MTGSEFHWDSVCQDFLDQYECIAVDYVNQSACEPSLRCHCSLLNCVNKHLIIFIYFCNNKRHIRWASPCHKQQYIHYYVVFEIKRNFIVPISTIRWNAYLFLFCIFRSLWIALFLLYQIRWRRIERWKYWKWINDKMHILYALQWCIHFLYKCSHSFSGSEDLLFTPQPTLATLC